MTFFPTCLKLLTLGIGCTDPSPPDAAKVSLVDYTAPAVTPNDDFVSYNCKDYGRFETDVDKSKERVYCRKGNIWDTGSAGEWLTCTESESMALLCA